MARKTNQNPKGPLFARGTVRRIAGIFGAVLLISLAAQFAVTIEAHFPAEGVFGAAAVYGFGTCAVMVVFAWLLGKLMKRPEGYYEPPEWEDGPHD